ncbi:MAG: hypothetical protein LBK59_08520, partial [Bifidobacteriaceae bacterium]|nr:hypothetical protein [Bifidobacteriaceae bacterium]
MTPDDIAALTAPAGRALLDSLPPYDADLAMRLSDDLRRRGVPPSLVAAALTQSRLRVRAHPKLGEFARTMLFTDTGLQQATRLTVAAHHARRLRDADLHHVADLTCGIGVDSMAMAALDLTVTAVDADPTTAAIAAHNLRHFPATRVIHGDGLSLDMDALGVDGIYADPSRRTSTGNRVFDPAAYSPPLDAILAHAKRRPLGLKVAPGIPHALLPPGTEAQWVSDAGTVVECTIWTGRLGRSGHPSGSDDVGGHAASAPRATRSALVLAAGHATEVVEGGGPRLGVGPLGDYLLEPNGAVIRASLIAEAAA